MDSRPIERKLAWEKWLKTDCMPMPSGRWIIGSGIELKDLSKYYVALLEDLQNENRTLYPGVVVSDMKGFARGWQVANWDERIKKAKNAEQLLRISADIRKHKDRLLPQHRRYLSQRCKEKISSFRGMALN